MKYFNFKRYKFSTILKNISSIRYNFSKVFNFTYLFKYYFRKIYKYLDIRKIDFKNLVKYLNPKYYNIGRIRKINIINYRFLVFHLPAAVVFFGFLYLVIPTFYKYEKSKLENLICKSKKIECLIRGKVSYNFYPTPRINIKDIVINELKENKKTIITIQRAAIKLSVKNLLAKEKHNFKKIVLNNFEINFDLKKLKKYKNIFTKKNNIIPISLKEGKIIFYDGVKYVASIRNTNIDLDILKDSIDAVLKGEFLNDSIYINFSSTITENKPVADILIKMNDSNLLAKASFFESEKNKNAISSNILIKKDKHKFTGIVDYKDNKIVVKKSNVRNIFLDGKLEGIIKLDPYFGFNLDLNLNSVNFTKLYTQFLSLNKESQKKLFKINNKINGKLNLSSDKIYSSYNLVKSFESRLEFNNGDIFVEQFLLNLGKLGAADILGTINNEDKFTNFKFESNIFVDNKKKFLSKFGIYNKKDISPNLFVSGNFDMKNIKVTFYEIFDGEKLKNEDLNFVEKEFNRSMLEKDYESLFRFPKFKEFVKTITVESN